MISTRDIGDVLEEDEGIIIERLKDLKTARITLSPKDLDSLTDNTRSLLSDLLTSPEMIKGKRIDFNSGNKRYKSTRILECYSVDPSLAEYVTASGAQVTVRKYSELDIELSEN